MRSAKGEFLFCVLKRFTNSFENSDGGVHSGQSRGPKTWNFPAKMGLCQAWNFSEQLFGRKVRGVCFFLVYCVKVIIKKGLKSNYCKAAINLCKQLVFVLKACFIIRMKARTEHNRYIVIEIAISNKVDFCQHF